MRRMAKGAPVDGNGKNTTVIGMGRLLLLTGYWSAAVDWSRGSDRC